MAKRPKRHPTQVRFEEDAYAALVAEAEVYREMLKLQAQTLRIYTLKAQKRIFMPSIGNPLLLNIVVPLISRFLQRRARKGKNLLARLAFLAPVVSSVFNKAAAIFQKGRKKSADGIFERFTRVF